MIVADPPYIFSDKLTMSNTKRGSESNYPVLTINELKKLDISKITAANAVLALWCPSTLVPDGLEIMKAWGFDFKQTWVWVKTKKEPVKNLIKKIKKDDKNWIKHLNEFDLNDILGFGLGRLFRQTHELALIGTKGKIYDRLANKAQRSVYFWPAAKHSEKPEGLQNRFEIMFPNMNYIEFFARRERPGWTCVGNEIPPYNDIRDILKKLLNVINK